MTLNFTKSKKIPGVTRQGAQNFRPRLCADKVYAPIVTTRRDDVTGGPVSHAANCRVKARRAPAARPVIVPQDQIHHVGLAVEQGVETRAEDDARAVAVPGCTACSAVARTRRHVALLRRAGGSVRRPAPRRRGGGGLSTLASQVAAATPAAAPAIPSTVAAAPVAEAVAAPVAEAVAPAIHGRAISTVTAAEA